MMVILKNNYSHCPLKKRPLSVCYDATGGEQTEPEDLSVKCGREAPPTLHPPSICLPETQESSTRGQHAPVIRAQEPRSNTFVAHDSGVCKIRAQEPHVLTTHTRISNTLRMRTQEWHAPTEDRQYPSAEERLPKPEAESSAPEMTQPSRSPKPQPHLDTRPPGQVPVSRSVTTYVSDSSCRSSGLHCTETTKPQHILSTSETMSTMPLLMATPTVHPTCSEPLISDVSSPRISLEEVSSESVELPSVHTKVNSRNPEATTPLAVHGQQTTPAAAPRPHRPWLAEDPPRQLLRQFQNVNVTLQPARPRPFLANTQSLWAGVVPLSWPIPHLLATSHPPSPGKHYRECGSPGSESASSDGSSGGGRGEARYSCTECGKSYSTYSGLSKHKQFHCAALGAKSFACKHCEKVYTSLGALKMHIRTHTLPCKCQLCGKAFSRPWLLQGHIRTHTGEKPFQCPQCDRCFADRSNLRAHLQTHADVKKYACAICHKTFSRMSLLNKHTEAACPPLHRRTQP